MARRLNKNKLINTKNLYIKYNSDNSYELCLIEKTGKGKSRSLSDTISPIIVYTNNYKVFSFKNCKIEEFKDFSSDNFNSLFDRNFRVLNKQLQDKELIKKLKSGERFTVKELINLQNKIDLQNNEEILNYSETKIDDLFIQ